MFYGVIHEEYYLSEFNIKEGWNNIRNKIKHAILSFIKKIDGLVDKLKEGKFKSFLKTITTKLRKLLGDTEVAENKKDFDKVMDEFKDYQDQVKKAAEQMSKENEKYKDIMKDFPKDGGSQEDLSQWFDSFKDKNKDLYDDLQRLKNDLNSGKTLVFK